MSLIFHEYCKLLHTNSGQLVPGAETGKNARTHAYIVSKMNMILRDFAFAQIQPVKDGQEAQLPIISTPLSACGDYKYATVESTRGNQVRAEVGRDDLQFSQSTLILPTPRFVLPRLIWSLPVIYAGTMS
jgi:hypothetical protein